MEVLEWALPLMKRLRTKNLAYRQSERKHLYKEYADQLIIQLGRIMLLIPEALDTFRKSEEEQGKHSYTIILTEKTRHIFGNFYRRNG
jgi:glutamyl-tRNA synthetase